MINGIKKGITQALYAAFGDDYGIYAEDVKQGLKTPCFFVQCINPSISRRFGGRLYRANQFAVQYFPQNEEYRSEIEDVIDRLYLALEFITADDKLIMGRNAETNVYDGVLTFTIDYNLYAVIEDGKEIALMDKLTIK